MGREEYPDNYIRRREKANVWHDFHCKFMQLASEEEQAIKLAVKANPYVWRDQYLRAYCDYKELPERWKKEKPERGVLCSPAHGLWIVSDGVDENFQARFRALAARAGIALGPPEGTQTEGYWLDQLYRNLRENGSKELFAASEEDGVILRVCVASATFCSRLERSALEQFQSVTPSEQLERSTTSAASDTKRRMGQNIDRFRKECGWSYDRLAGATGIDKKLVLAHVHGKHKPKPSTQREYTEAFSKQLRRHITPLELDN